MGQFAFACIKQADSGARLGRIVTSHGSVNTPAFMPVATHGTVKGITRNQLHDLGAEIILANAYHLYLRPGVEIVAAAGGLHRFIGWERPMLTDSGGYQVFSLSGLREVTEDGVTFRSTVDGSEHFLSPEAVIDIEQRLGADIIMSFDEPVPFGATRGDAEAITARSDRWAERGKRAHDRNAECALFGIVQGGFWEDLRAESAQRIMELDFDGYALGGLSVGEPKAMTLAIAAALTRLLPREKPRYLMGMGLPGDIVRGVSVGVDMFDCVLPTRMGRNGTALNRYERLNLRNTKYIDDFRPLDDTCDCMTCRYHSRAYLRHLHKSQEILAAVLICHHNLRTYQRLMADIRAAIAEGRFDEFRHEYESRSTYNGE